MSSSATSSSSLKDMQTFQQTIQELLDAAAEKCTRLMMETSTSSRSGQENHSEIERKAILDPALNFINEARIILAQIKVNVTKNQLTASKRKYLKCLQRYKEEESELRRLKRTVEDLDATQLIETTTELSNSNLSSPFSEPVDIEAAPNICDCHPPAQKRIRMSPDSTPVPQEAHLNAQCPKSVSSTELHRSPPRRRKSTLSSASTQTHHSEADSTPCEQSNAQTEQFEPHNCSKKPRHTSTASIMVKIPLAATSQIHEAQSTSEPQSLSNPEKQSRELSVTLPAVDKAGADIGVQTVQFDFGSSLIEHSAAVGNKFIRPSMCQQIEGIAQPVIESNLEKPTSVAGNNIILPSMHKQVAKEAYIITKSNLTEPFSATPGKRIKEEPLPQTTVEDAQTDVECNLPESTSATAVKAIHKETEIAQNKKCTLAIAGKKPESMNKEIEIAKNTNPTSAIAVNNLAALHQKTEIAKINKPTSVTAGKKQETMHKVTEIAKNNKPMSGIAVKNLESMLKKTDIPKNNKATSGIAVKKFDSIVKNTETPMNNKPTSGIAVKRLDSMLKNTETAKNNKPTSGTAGKNGEPLSIEKTQSNAGCNLTETSSIVRRQSLPSKSKSCTRKPADKTIIPPCNTKKHTENDILTLACLPRAGKDTAAPSVSHPTSVAIPIKNTGKEHNGPAIIQAFKIPKLNSTAAVTKNQTNHEKPKERTTAQKTKIENRLIKKPKDDTGSEMRNRKAWERYRDREMYRWNQRIEERRLKNADGAKTKEPMGDARFSRNLPNVEPPKNTQTSTNQKENINPAASYNQVPAERKRVAKRVITTNLGNKLNARNAKKVKIAPFLPRRCSTPLLDCAKEGITIDIPEIVQATQISPIHLPDDVSKSNTAPIDNISDRTHQKCTIQSQSGTQTKSRVVLPDGKYNTVTSQAAQEIQIPNAIQPRTETTVSMDTQNTPQESPFLIIPLRISPKLKENMRRMNRLPIAKRPIASFTQTLKDIEAAALPPKRRKLNGDGKLKKLTSPIKTLPRKKCPTPRRKSQAMTNSELSSILNRPDVDSVNVTAIENIDKSIPESFGRYKSPEERETVKEPKEIPRKLTLSECFEEEERCRKIREAAQRRDTVKTSSRNIFRKPLQSQLQHTIGETFSLLKDGSTDGPKASNNPKYEWFNMDKVNEMLIHPDGSGKPMSLEVMDYVLTNTLKGYVPRCSKPQDGAALDK